MITSRFPPLDELDLKLMRELELDARQTHTAISAKLGVSRLTVAHRLRQLKDYHVITTVCLVDPAALGYKFILNLGINTEQGKISDVAHRLANCAKILHIHLCAGTFNILALVWIRETDKLSYFIQHEIDPIPGIRNVEVLLTLEEVKVSARFLSDGREPQCLEHPAEWLDDFDLRLIKEIQTDTTQKVGQLARNLGVDKTTIIRRKKRLLNGHVITIRTAIHPFALGYDGIATIGLKCNQDKVNKIASVVASFQRVQYVSICTGRYDILTWVVFRTLSDLRHFINTELRGIFGLRDIDTMINYKMIKALITLPPNE